MSIRPKRSRAARTRSWMSASRLTSQRTAIACGRHGRETVTAVDVLAHEAWHLRERDTRFVAVSRGEQEHLQRYREHMGWAFPWYTLRDDFDADHDVGEWHGTNVFLRDGDEVYRTYFIDARGDEAGDSALRPACARRGVLLAHVNSTAPPRTRAAHAAERRH